MQGDPDVDNTVVDMAFCLFFILWPHRESSAWCIDRYRRPGSSSPGLFPLHIYKVGEIIPTVATSQVIIDIEAGLMITQTNVSSLYDDVLVCSKHISGPWGMQGPFGLKWSLNEPVFWVQ